MNKKTLFFLTCALTLQGCGDPVDRYLESGRSYYKQEDYANAKLEFKNALQIDNKLADAYYHLALIDEKDQNWKGMIGSLAQAIKFDPENYDARLKYGQILLISGDFKKARTEVDLILNSNANNVDAIALNGAILLKQGDTSAALAEAEKALTIDPAHLDSVSLQVVVYMAQKDYVTAEKIVNKALEAKSDELSLNLLKLQIHTKSKNLLAVEKDYQDLINRFPSQLEFTYKLAKFYVSTQRDSEALVLLQDAVEKNAEELKPKLVLVDFYLQRNKSKVEEVLNQFIKENSGETDLYFRLANFYIGEKKFDQAKVPLNLIVDLKEQKNEGLTAKILLAKLAVQERDNTTASAMVKDVLAIDTRHFEALLLKARISAINGLYDEAIIDLRGILRDYSSSDEAMVLLAQVYLKKNSPELAAVNFRKALDLNPGNFSAVMPVVSSMIKSKDIGLADEVLFNALKIKPDHAGALQALAQVKLLKKDWVGTQKVADLISTQPGGEGFSKYLGGKVSQAQGLYEDAIGKYKLALAVTPTLSDALKSMLVCYEALKQRDEMIVYLDEFMQKNPEAPSPVILKSQLYGLNKDWDKALAVLNEGAEQWPDVPQFYIAIARIYNEKDEKQKVIEIYKKGLENAPDNARLQVFLASAYETDGDYDSAVQYYEALIAKQPNVDMAVNNLVSLLLDHYPGKESTERAVKLAKRFENSEQPYFLDTYGWALFHNGNIEEAVVIFKQVVLKKPDVTVFKYHLGLGYSKLNQNDNAIVVLEQALELADEGSPFLEKDLAIQLLKEIKAKGNETV